MNEELIMKMAEASVKNGVLTYSLFDRIYGMLSRREQYQVCEILNKNNIQLEDTYDFNEYSAYLINDGGTSTKETGVVLGILEALDVLSFKMIGGANSQLYIYINQIQTLKNIISSPVSYDNRLLKSVSERHLISVKMLSYLYENGFSSEEMWNILESYFLGQIPAVVKHACLSENPEMRFD